MNLPELEASWSRFVDAPDHEGISRTWHLLDTHAATDSDSGSPTVTLLCVHGNPTWSYLWRNVLAGAPESMRVIAVDQLEMGWSERTNTSRTLANRIDDLDHLTAGLNLTGPVIVVAHDWGGPIAVGWAMRHRDQLRGLVLTNTAVHQPTDRRFPVLIDLARRTLPMTTQRTSMFLRGTTALSGRRMTGAVAQAFRAPYLSADRRKGIRDFVADIPMSEEHPSWETLSDIAEEIRSFTDVPTLLIWGAGDPVFSDTYLHDLQTRLPHAQVHRYAHARHLVCEDEPQAIDLLLDWCQGIDQRGAADDPLPAGLRLWEPLESCAQHSPAGVALTWAEKGQQRAITWRQLRDRVNGLATGFSRSGIKRGDRVSVLIPPSADLVAVVYALWRIGASAVIADAGLGPQGLRRALRHAAPDHVIGIRRGLLLAKSIHIPGSRIPANRLVDYAAVIDELPEPPVNSEAVVVFTSGATGPAKGVIYTQAQIQRTRDVIARTYDISSDDALVAAFAPWAVLGPTLGIPSAIPDMDVTNPRTLTARAVADATHSVAGTIMWASPAALTNIVATANDLQQPKKLATLRLIMGAGAPVSRTLLQEVQRLIPDADLGTPYGMTEVLPVCDVRLSELQDVGWGNGVLVGRPVEGVTIAVRPLDDAGNPSGELVRQPQITGEIYVRAPHMRKSYDRLAAVDMRSAAGWHATGDVGHLDADDRLWIEGRLVHVIVTENGIVTPVGIEQVCELAGETAAIVGIGPRGHQQVVAVITGAHGPLADPEKTGQLRSLVHDQTGIDLAAVLVRPQLPVDIRHQAKIDRLALSKWAEKILAGAS